VGRADVLARLSTRLLAGAPAGRVARIYGASGAGKTALAQQAARSLADYFPGGILWLDIGPRATQTSVTAVACAATGAVCALRTGAVQEVQTALSGHGRILAVIDDLDDAGRGQWILRSLLPPDCAVIVCTRSFPVAMELPGALFPLDGLPDADARQMLAARIGPVTDDAAGANSQATAHSQAVGDIIALTGGLPLALDLAARLYLEDPGELRDVAAMLTGAQVFDLPVAVRRGNGATNGNGHGYGECCGRSLTVPQSGPGHGRRPATSGLMKPACPPRSKQSCPSPTRG
jgi:hypothetical protein